MVELDETERHVGGFQRPLHLVAICNYKVALSQPKCNCIVVSS